MIYFVQQIDVQDIYEYSVNTILRTATTQVTALKPDTGLFVPFS